MHIEIEFRARFKKSVEDNFATTLKRKMRKIFREVSDFEVGTLTVMKTSSPGQKSWDIKVIPPHKADLQGPLPRHSVVVEIFAEVKLGFICIFTVPEQDPACITHLIETLGDTQEDDENGDDTQDAFFSQPNGHTEEPEEAEFLEQPQGESDGSVATEDETLRQQVTPPEEDGLEERLLLNGTEYEEVERLKSTLAAVCVSKLSVRGMIEDFSIEPKELSSFMREHLHLSGITFADGRGVISNHLTRCFKATGLATKIDSVWYFDGKAISAFIGNDFEAIWNRAEERRKALAETPPPACGCTNDASSTTPKSTGVNGEVSLEKALESLAALEVTKRELSEAENVEEALLAMVAGLQERLATAQSDLLAAQRRTAMLRTSLAEHARVLDLLKGLREKLNTMQHLFED